MLLVVLLFVGAVRLEEYLAHTWAIAVVAISPWALLLALPLLVFAAVTRRRLLAAFSIVPLVGFCAWGLPDFWPFPPSATPAGPAVVRLLDANIAQSNRTPSDIVREIRVDRPNVVALEELTAPALAYLDRSGALANYRWKVVATRPGPAGTGLWSALPMSGAHTWDNETQAEIEATLHPAAGPAIHMAVLHDYAPIGTQYSPLVWRTQLAAIRGQLTATPEPLLAAGDFNATWDMQPFRQILSLGLTDVAVQRGMGWQMTWPNNVRPVLPFLRIDHVLVSHQLVATSYQVGPDVGSDHRSLFATIADRSR